MYSKQQFRTVALAFALLSAICGCGGGDSGTSESPPTAATGTPTGSPATPTASPRKTPDKPRFASRIRRVSRSELRYSWRSGCPVPVSGLRMIEMTYWGMDDRSHGNGRLVVNASAADDLVKVFRKLYDQRYPIHRMEPVDAYQADDFDSIEADNTSAFNCRAATGSSSWSQHAYGLAVDLNPCENPYVTASGEIAHEHCVKFGDRSRRDPGVIHAGDKVVRAFGSIGWGWGGEWSGTRDFQHFSASGR